LRSAANTHANRRTTSGCSGQTGKRASPTHPWLCQASSAGTKAGQTAGSSPARINNSAYNQEDRDRPERERKDTGTTSWSEPAKRRLTTIPGRVIRLAG